MIKVIKATVAFFVAMLCVVCFLVGLVQLVIESEIITGTILLGMSSGLGWWHVSGIDFHFEGDPEDEENNDDKSDES